MSLTHEEKQIENQINQDYQKFANSEYKSEVKTPSNLIELFKKAILILPSFSHKINFQKVKTIASKTVDQLHVSDVHEIIKVVSNVPLEKLYEGQKFEDVVDNTIKFEKFILQYNKDVEDFTNKLKLKKDNLLLLATGGSRNGMRIIQA